MFFSEPNIFTFERSKTVHVRAVRKGSFENHIHIRFRNPKEL